MKQAQVLSDIEFKRVVALVTVRGMDRYRARCRVGRRGRSRRVA
jgi:hypothetical protein